MVTYQHSSPQALEVREKIAKKAPWVLHTLRKLGVDDDTYAVSCSHHSYMSLSLPHSSLVEAQAVSTLIAHGEDGVSKLSEIHGIALGPLIQSVSSLTLMCKCIF